MSATDTSPLTSASLLLRATQGDGEAWQRVVQIYAPLVYKWCRRYGLSPEDAADVSQETFTSLTQKLGAYDSTVVGATFRGWLRTVTRNKIADFHRQKQAAHARGGTANVAALADMVDVAPSLSRADGSSVASGPADGGLASLTRDASSDRSEVLRRALAILRPRFEKQTWTAFWRTTVDGCSPDDVADELGVSRWSVYKARSRVLHRLRQELAGLEEF